MVAQNERIGAMALRKKQPSKTRRSLSQRHKDNISKALKAYHAKGKRSTKARGRRTASNDNTAGATRREVKMNTSRGSSALPYENRWLSKRQLKSYKDLRSALKKHGAKMNDMNTYNKKAHKAQPRYLRNTKINNFLSKFLPKTKKKAR